MEIKDVLGKDNKRVKDFIFNALIGGFVVILPLAILYVIFGWMFSFILKIVSPISQLLVFSTEINTFIANSISIAVLLIICFGLGVGIRTAFGKYLYAEIEERFLSKLPLYRAIRETIRHFSEKNDNSPFRQVVLVDVYENSTLQTGFITDRHEDSGRITVFVPTGPNPTNGFIFHVKKHQIIPVDIPIEDALKTVIGVGSGGRKLFDAVKDKSQLK